MKQDKQENNWNIFELMIQALFKSGLTCFTVPQAIKIINRLKDRYPFIQYISRTGRGHQFDIKHPITFAHQLITNMCIVAVHEINDGKVFDIRTTTDTKETVILISPVYYSILFSWFTKKTISEVLILRNIYTVPEDAIEVAKETLFEK
jgi:hypothetical protein